MEASSATQPKTVASRPASASSAHDKESIAPAPKVASKVAATALKTGNAKAEKTSAPRTTAKKSTSKSATSKSATSKSATSKSATTGKPATRQSKVTKPTRVKSPKTTSPKTTSPKASTTRSTKTARSSATKPSETKPSKLQQARHQKTGELAQDIIRTHFLSSIQYKKAVLADRDPEDLHQMRVSLRRLRTAIAIFSPVMTVPEPMRDRRLAHMAKTLGAVRDIDVLQQWLQTYQKQSNPSKAEQKQLKKLQKRLAKRRKKSFAGVKKLLKSKPFDAFIQAMEAWLKVPLSSPLSALPIQALLPDLLLPLVSQLLLHPGWCTATEGQGDQLIPIANLSPEDLEQALKHHGDELHALRKQIKQVRYEAEMFQDCFGRTYGNRLKEFKTLQTVLGDFQDEVVLSHFLTAELGSQWQQKLPQLAQFFQAQHGENWQAWQILQKQYLDLSFRQKLRQTFTI